MREFVKTHTLLNLWAAPYQDHQHHIRLVRFTPPGGVLREYPVLWDRLLVPVHGKGRDYFHFYQIGQVPAEVVDVIRIEDCWVSLKDLNAKNDIHVDVYTELGAIVPKDHVWVSFLYNKNFVVAIKNNPKIDMGTIRTKYRRMNPGTQQTIDNSKFIIRFYSNARHGNPEFINAKANPDRDYLGFEYRVAEDANAFGEIYRKGTLAGEQRPEPDEYNNSVLWFGDGLLRPNLTTPMPEKLKGEVVGYTWDDSVILVEDFDLTELRPFISKKDPGTRKYIVTLDPRKLKGYITYWDDIDIYIYNIQNDTGLYYNRVGINAMTMITPNTFALNADMVEDYIDYLSEMDSIRTTKIRVVVRQGGREIPTFNQKNRLLDFLDLTVADQNEVLTDTTSQVPEWKADELERSSYMTLLGSHPDEITPELLTDAYGYNGISETFLKPLHTREEGERLKLANGLCIEDTETDGGKRSFWYYDADGWYMGYTNSESLNNEYQPPDPYGRSKYVETFNMLAKDKLTAIGNKDVESKLLKQYGFSCFLGKPNADGIVLTWEETTHSNNFYTYDPGNSVRKPKITWKWRELDKMGLKPLVLIHDTILVQEFDLHSTRPYDGCLELELTARYTWGNAEITTPCYIPLGQIDVFYDNQCLIENVDYFVNYPRIVVVNKEINKDPSGLFTVRGFGFSDRVDNKPFPPSETGFVKAGVISADGVHQLRHGENNRIIVDGRLFPVTNRGSDRIYFAEAKSPEEENHKDEEFAKKFEGRPYEIKDYILPVTNITTLNNSYELYRDVKEIDKRIEDYLSAYYRGVEKNTRDRAVTIERQLVISPVISMILHEFKAGNRLTNIPDNFDNEHVKKYMQSKLWLLKHDPAALEVDEDYFHILPHALDEDFVITKKQYTFLEYVIRMYLNRRVDLSIKVKIGA